MCLRGVQGSGHGNKHQVPFAPEIGELCCVTGSAHEGIVAQQLSAQGHVNAVMAPFFSHSRLAQPIKHTGLDAPLVHQSNWPAR
jgi:hypothetical protein